VYEELDRVMSNPDNVIMSEGLSDVLNVASVHEQTLTLNDATYMCTMQSAKLLSMATHKWEFRLEVPGLDFGDIAMVPEAAFNYGGRTFADLSSIELICEHPDNFLILALREIVIAEEDLSNE